MIDLIFHFKLFNAKKLCSEIVIEVELNCSVFTSLCNSNQGDLGLLKILFRTFRCFIVNDKKVHHRLYHTNKNRFQALHVEVMLLMLQSVIDFLEF